MKKISFLQILFSGLLILSAFPDSAYSQGKKKVVIAHRGSSGYVPEHTLEAKAMAFAYGADYLEQDLVMTKDDKIVVLHDPHLDRVTDVQDRFPGRERKDGRFHAIDFTLEEIRSLFVLERYKVSKDGKRTAVFPKRFPLGKSRFKVHTFEEEIEFIQGLNHSTGKNVGIYPEIKRPEFHLEEGKDISKAVLTVLKKYGYTKKSDAVYLQVFGFDELKRIHDVVMPSLDMDVKVVFLIGSGKKYAWTSSTEGMGKVAKYADGIGPDIGMIVPKKTKRGELKITGFVKYAHAAGLVVHPYTFRIEEDAIPGYAKDFDDLLDIFYNQADIDGCFTDFPDRVIGLVTESVTIKNAHKNAPPISTLASGS